MKEYSLAGITVYFPYEAYECQLLYMTKVIEALQQGCNGLLESPTGTGKTLCLLCAALAWQVFEKQKLLSGGYASEMTQGSMRGGGGGGQHSGDVPGEATMQSGERGMFDESKALLKQRWDDMHSNDNQLWDQVYSESRNQQEDQKSSKGKNKVPTILYSSRTHGQLAQVIKELKKTSYKPKSVVLGSRQQMCVHPEVRQYRGSDLQLQCKGKVKSRQCSYKNNTSAFRTSEGDRILSEMLDIEDLNQLGSSQNVCPYFLSRGLLQDAEIVFLPYNYLIDKKVGGLDDNVFYNSVVIFDEAHNLESICEDSASCSFPTSCLALGIQEAKCITESINRMTKRKQKKHIPVLNPDSKELAVVPEEAASSATAITTGSRQEQKDAQNQKKNEHLVQVVVPYVVRLLGMFEAETRQLSVGKDGKVFDGGWLEELFMKVNLQRNAFQTTQEHLTQLVEYLSEIIVLKDGGRQTGSNLQMFAELMDTVLASEGSAQDFKCYVQLDEAFNNRSSQRSLVKDYIINYWCFNPGVGMRKIQKREVRSVILTSGTLHPLNSFAQELQLDFPIQLENSHVIDQQQVSIGVLSSGPARTRFNSSYQFRSDVGYQNDLGSSIAIFANQVPDGMLVFFPSYNVMTQTINTWQIVDPFSGDTRWERIQRNKHIVVEPRDSSLFPRAMTEFREKINEAGSKGAVLFAVCRGKVSEGLDFSDREGRAVIITGIPYANLVDMKVSLKRQWLDARKLESKAGISGSQWYQQQASRAVNQAIGRVIRHRHDYGVIILCDERFSERKQKQEISKWLRDRICTFNQFQNATATIHRFFSFHKNNPAPPQIQLQTLINDDENNNDYNNIQNPQTQIVDDPPRQTTLQLPKIFGSNNINDNINNLNQKESQILESDGLEVLQKQKMQGEFLSGIPSAQQLRLGKNININNNNNVIDDNNNNKLNQLIKNNDGNYNQRLIPPSLSQKSQNQGSFQQYVFQQSSQKILKRSRIQFSKKSGGDRDISEEKNKKQIKTSSFWKSSDQKLDLNDDFSDFQNVEGQKLQFSNSFGENSFQNNSNSAIFDENTLGLEAARKLGSHNYEKNQKIQINQINQESDFSRGQCSSRNFLKIEIKEGEQDEFQKLKGGEDGKKVKTPLEFFQLLKRELRTEVFQKIQDAFLDFKKNKNVYEFSNVIIGVLKRDENTKWFLTGFLDFLPEKDKEYFETRIKTILSDE